MFSLIRKRATYANVAMTLALVFAMTGGAYAAKKYLITSTKQISPSVLKALAGKAGAVGAQGSAGPQGPAGPAGAKGDAGAEGKIGPEGKTGATGQKGATGATGPKGEPGEPWTAGGTLPTGKTETGMWSGAALVAALNNYPLTISFPIPLSTPSKHVVFLNKEETENSVASPKEGCKYEASSVTAKPIAPSDTLCVFALAELEGTKVFKIGPSSSEPSDIPTGAILWANTVESFEGLGYLDIYGTWAVTAG